MLTQGLPMAVWTNFKLLIGEYGVLIGLTQEHISGFISVDVPCLFLTFTKYLGCVTGIYSRYKHLQQTSMPLLTEQT